MPASAMSSGRAPAGVQASSGAGSSNVSSLLHTTQQQRRNRAKLSCQACRHGKLKCNRAHPCDQCIKRAKGETCRYAAPPVPRDAKDTMRERLHRLESLVLQLMNENGANGSGGDAESGEGPATGSTDQDDGMVDGDSSSHNDGSPSSAAASDLQSFGQLSIGKTETVYVGSSHWSAIFEQINEVKSCLDVEVEEPASEKTSLSDDPTLALFFDAPSSITREELLRQLPPREKADRLIGAWLHIEDPLTNVIHRPAFQEQYRKFWENPSNAPTMWLALLFGLLSISSFFFSKMVDPGSPPGASSNSAVEGPRFKQLAAAALVLADYSKTPEHTLEALITYGNCEYFWSRGALMRTWLLMGLVARLALRMGLHRDPDNFPNITPFQGEIRRRIWNTLEQIDALSSFQIGLPSMIRTINSDTRRPQNLMDADFGEHTLQLPPERPMEDFTPVTYSISKLKLCKVFAEAAALTHLVILPNEAEILKIDKQLQEAKSLVPPILRVKPMHLCIGDSPHLIICRFNLEFLYNKTIIILHRRFLTDNVSESQRKHSRRVLVEAAVEYMQHHKIIYEESLPGGRFTKIPWYLTSLKTADFILAAVIICLILSMQFRGAANDEVAELDECPYTVAELKGYLESSYTIWKTLDQPDPDTLKATQMIRAMLDRIETMWYPSRESNSEQSLSMGSSSSGPRTLSLVSSENTSGISPSNVLQDIDKNSLGLEFPELMDTDYFDFNALDGLFNQPSNVNWESWDSIINAP